MYWIYRSKNRLEKLGELIFSYPINNFVKLVSLMMIFLFVVFRKISAVFLPIFIVAVAFFTTIGFLTLIGVPVSLPTQILP